MWINNIHLVKEHLCWCVSVGKGGGGGCRLCSPQVGGVRDVCVCEFWTKCYMWPY